jgi:hypothetical protein
MTVTHNGKQYTAKKLNDNEWQRRVSHRASKLTLNRWQMHIAGFLEQVEGEGMMSLRHYTSFASASRLA